MCPRTRRVLNQHIKHIFSDSLWFKCVIVSALWHRMEFLWVGQLHLDNCHQLPWEFKVTGRVCSKKYCKEILNQAGVTVQVWLCSSDGSRVHARFLSRQRSPWSRAASSPYSNNRCELLHVFYYDKQLSGEAGGATLPAFTRKFTHMFLSYEVTHKKSVQVRKLENVLAVSKHASCEHARTSK